jgi:hypothetical protein
MNPGTQVTRPTATTFIGAIVKADTPPDRPGLYLLLAWEWVGTDASRPRDPSWSIREWGGREWEHQTYHFDTGCMENFEPHAWCRIPTNRPQFQEP